MIHDRHPELHWSKNEINTDIDRSNRHEKRMKKAILASEERKRKEELRSINSTHRPIKEWRKKMTTTKRLMYAILINCIVIEIYSMYVMVALQDLSSLYSLIGAVVGESVCYAIYCAKSFNDSKEEAKSKLERDRFYMESGLTEEDFEELENLKEDPIPEDDDHSGDIPEGIIVPEESEC